MRDGYRKCEQCQRNRAARFYTGPKGRICATCRRKKSRNNSRGQRLLNTYGLTLGEYDRLFEAQGGRCAICKETRKQNLSVDHCHKTGAVRGLLCRLCNGRLLTAARDRVDVLMSAADYLQNYPVDKVLGRRYVNAFPPPPPISADRTELPEID